MTEFLSSISWFGWALIALLAMTLWQLPAILRMVLQSNRGDTEAPVRPGEGAPHLNAPTGTPDDGGGAS